MSTERPAVAVSPEKFKYYALRRVTSPEDSKNNRNIYTGTAPARSFLHLEENENVREYLLAESQGKRGSDVHLAIRETLENKPEDFCILNGGITIVARHVKVDNAAKTAELMHASIINGSQTRGELKRFFEEKREIGDQAFLIHVAFEIIETDDEALIAEISIARNFQNRVLPISIIGRRGQLDELNEYFAQCDSDRQLQKSESDRSESYLRTEKLLQVITALLPNELWHKANEKDNPNKTYTYSAKATCLKDFSTFYEQAKSENATQEEKERYQFFLDICCDAWKIYETWKTHSGFKGTGLHALKRDKAGNILEIPDGIVFPIIAALSVLAKKEKGKWTLSGITPYVEGELIKTAKRVYMEIADSNPQTMGKSKACYSSLNQVTEMYHELTK